MTDDQIAILRDTLARLAARFKAPLSISTFVACVATAGFRCDRETILDHLEYLKIIGFLEEVERSHTGQIQQWRITAKGLLDLEKRGLA